MEEKDVLGFVASQMRGILNHIQQKYPERTWMYEMRAAYWERVWRAGQEGKPLVWHNMATTSELFYAMDVVPLCTDMLATVLSAFPGGVAPYADLAQGYVPDHVCAIDRTLLGLALGGYLPKPDAILHASQPCDSALITYPVLAEYLEVPHFCMDTPYWNDQRSYDYAAAELERMVGFVEETTGARLNYDKLRQVAQRSNQAYQLLAEINQLRRHVPCPLPGKFLPLTGGMFGACAGLPELVDFVERERDWAVEKASKGEGALKEEKLRLGWVQVPLFFNTSLFDWLENGFGAIAVMDMLNSFLPIVIDDPADRSRVFQGLGRRSLNMVMGRESRGPADYYVRSSVEMCREFGVDVAIASGHLGCKQMWGAFQLVKDVIADELGIPTFIYDCDHLDPRVVSFENIQARFEEFFSALASKG